MSASEAVFATVTTRSSTKRKNRQQQQQQTQQQQQQSPPPSVKKQHKKQQQKHLENITKSGSTPLDYHRKASWGFKPSGKNQAAVAVVAPTGSSSSNAVQRRFSTSESVLLPDGVPKVLAGASGVRHSTPVVSGSSDLELLCVQPARLVVHSEKENHISAAVATTPTATDDYLDIAASVEAFRAEMLHEEELEQGEELSYVIKTPKTAAHDVVVYGLTEFGIEHARNQYLTFDGRKSRMGCSDAATGPNIPCVLEMLNMLLQGYFVQIVSGKETCWIGLSLLNQCATACLQHMKLNGYTRFTKRLWLECIVSQVLKDCNLPDNKPGARFSPSLAVAAASVSKM